MLCELRVVEESGESKKVIASITVGPYRARARSNTPSFKVEFLSSCCEGEEEGWRGGGGKREDPSVQFLVFELRGRPIDFICCNILRFSIMR